MTITDNLENLRRQRGNDASLQQQEAADPLCSVWVEASAGTGKTKVLSDRVLRLLLNNVSASRILCLTYTKAAAVEMNNRIAERLSRWAIMPENKLEENLYRLLGRDIRDAETLQKYKKQARRLFAMLLDTPGGLKIQTIHSFCQEILQRFPLEAGITPYFSVLDEASSKQILQQIQTDMLKNAEQKKDEAIADALQYLTANLSEFSFPSVMKNITDNRVKIAAIFNRYGTAEKFSHALADNLQINPQISINELKDRFMQDIDVNAAKLNIAAWAKGGKKDVERSDKLTQVLHNNCRATDFELYKSIFCTEKGAIAANLAAKDAIKADNMLPERLQKEACRLQEAEQKIVKTMLFHSTTNVMTIAAELNRKYDEYKRKNAKLDYTDLIVLTKQLLADSGVAAWVLYKLDGGIDHILIDEAQDTSPEQWDIIKSLSNEFFAGEGAAKQQKTIFAVGDRKQSIYSFQGADPEKLDTMARYFAQKGEKLFKKVDLKVSFRSAAAILDTVNNLFADEKVAQGVTAVGEKVNHLPFRAGEFGRVEIWPPLIADKSSKDKNKNYWRPPVEMITETSVSTLLAQKIARHIRKMIDDSANSYNPLHFRDFMVLVQRRAGFVEDFIRACKQCNVNISGADRLKLSEQIVVQDLISLGKFLLLPNDDLSLAEVLKSPIFGLDDNDLIKLCHNRGQAPLWTRLGDFDEYKAIYQQLQDLFNMLDYIRPYELYNHVLTKMKGRFRFTERMGIEVEDALDEFINLTIKFEQENIPTLQGFIDWIGQADVEIKRETEQNDVDAVRLMTVHGSKGLQAPIVFLPDTIRVKNTKREQNLLLNDKMIYYPLGSDYYDESCNQINAVNARKADEEYRRLLYVALTRAEDRLFICGYSNQENINPHSWYALCLDCLKKSGVKQENIYVCESENLISKEQKENRFTTGIKHLTPPEWINQNVGNEELLAKPYTPSKIEDEEELDSSSPLEESGNFYRRGSLIHKILQFLPAKIENPQQIISDYLQKYAADFSPMQKQQIIQEILNLIHCQELAEVFGENARAEVPIMGEVDGKIISAQIDRLVILPHEIIIVDFKTNRPAAQTLAETPQTYIKQLQMYADIMQKIYPQHLVKAYILWTNQARIMKIV